MDNITPKGAPNRRWPYFTIRDVLWLMVVVGLTLGWWNEHRRLGNAPSQLRTLVDILGQHQIDVELGPNHVHVVAPNFNNWQDLGFPISDN